MRVGSSLFLMSCIIVLWAYSDAPWWLFAICLIGGAIINALCGKLRPEF